MSLINIRERLGARMRNEESGFSLVELLVVMLILGLLAAIAIPAFFNQREKAQDADAKAAVRTAQTAIETYATDNGSDYTSADAGALAGIEPTLTDATLAVSDADTTGYIVTTTSETGNRFHIERDGGSTSLTCDGGADEGSGVGDTGQAGCPTSGFWGGDEAS